MIRILSALALGAMASLALAQPATQTDAPSAPVKLTTTQMDTITAGANPHDPGETGNPHDFLNPGGQEHGCQNNPNCVREKGNPH
jgi:hypothetical protein